MDKLKYPIVVLKAWAGVLNDIRGIVEKHNSLLKTVQDDGDVFKVVFKGDFYFSIYNPLLSKDLKVLINIARCPGNINTTKEASSTYSLSSVLTTFEDWLNIIQQYESIALTQEEKFAKQYEEEFYEEFELVEEDATTSPFEPSTQLLVYKLLTAIEEIVSKEDTNNEDIKSILQETNDLKHNIQKLSKKSVVRWLAKIYARTKKHSLKLLLEVLDLTKKEGIKRLINEGFDSIGNLIT